MHRYNLGWTTDEIHLQVNGNKITQKGRICKLQTTLRLVMYKENDSSTPYLWYAPTHHAVLTHVQIAQSLSGCLLAQDNSIMITLSQNCTCTVACMQKGSCMLHVCKKALDHLGGANSDYYMITCIII